MHSHGENGNGPIYENQLAADQNSERQTNVPQGLESVEPVSGINADLTTYEEFNTSAPSIHNSQQTSNVDTNQNKDNVDGFTSVDLTYEELNSNRADNHDHQGRSNVDTNQNTHTYDNLTIQPVEGDAHMYASLKCKPSVKKKTTKNKDRYLIKKTCIK